MSPPLRDRGDHEKLWRGLASNELQAVGTDHCPFFFDKTPGKLSGKGDFSKIPSGAPGIENRMSRLFHGGVVGGHFDVSRFVEITSTAPAKIFGLFPRKGTIARGSDADVVIFDPEAEMVISAGTHHMNVDYNPYEGLKVKGVAETVFSRGEPIIENGEFTGRPGRGSFVARSPCNPGSAFDSEC
jgi:dihydropyrimidinase